MSTLLMCMEPELNSMSRSRTLARVDLPVGSASPVEQWITVIFFFSLHHAESARESAQWISRRAECVVRMRAQHWVKKSMGAN